MSHFELSPEPAAPPGPDRLASPLALVRDALREPGTPLDAGTRARFEHGFGHDFSRVRVHTDERAAAAAQAIGADAFAFGPRIAFARGMFRAGQGGGEHLLAHELAHVVQQQTPAGGPVRIGGTDDSAEVEARTLAARALTREDAGVAPQAFLPTTSGEAVVRRQQATATQPVRPAGAADAAEFLEDMAAFVETLRSVARVDASRGDAAGRQRANRVLNQQKLRDLLANARRAFEVQGQALAGGDPAGTRLRVALLAVVASVRQAALDALAISDAMPAPRPTDERRLNAQLIAELIEADPFTSAGLLGVPAFGRAEVAAGERHQAFISAYLDDLLRTIPGQQLAAADRDRILERIAAGLRRSFLTVGAGPAGALGVRAISDPAIAEKYRRVIAALSASMSARPPQLNVITDSPPAFVLPPDPVPDVTAQLRASPGGIGVVDLSQVPAIELRYVRFGVLQLARTVFAPGSTIQLRNASWPVVLQVRRGGNIVRVRYDLLFDAASNVRVERLGEAAPREVAPAFAQLSVADKRRQLVADFGLAAVDDRPAAPATPAAAGRPAAPARPAAAWTGPELDQVKAVYDLLPARDRAALRGVTLVRDHHGPPLAGGFILGGLAHTAADPQHDEPVPPPHPPPHIHYYDDAFASNDFTVVGAPGATGPGADWTIAHEVGHIRIYLATTQANAAIRAANAMVTPQLLAAVNAPLPMALHQIRQAWGNARTAANQAILAVNNAVIATPPALPAQRAQLAAAARAAIQARDRARAALAAAAVPPAMPRAAASLDAAADALLAASLQLGAAQDQIPTFVALAATFGFTPFTDYARRGGNDEFFAETYALYVTDPNRLSQMNRSIFLWFEAGMPMDPTWRPAP